MDSEMIIELVQALANKKLLVVDTGECLADCKIEVHRKKREDGKEVVLLIAVPK